MRGLLREWGAFTFVITVLIGAVAVAISLAVTGSRTPPAATIPPCPSYTPYVVTPTPKPTPSTSAHAGTSASASATASATPAVTATPFNPALVNCATPPLPPTSAPTPTLKPGTTPVATPPPTAAGPTPLP